MSNQPRNTRSRTWVDATDRRLLHTGAPLLLANATFVVIPIIARQYLSSDDYSVFALLLTVIVGAGLLDLGGSAYVQSLGFGRRTTAGQYAAAVGLAAGGAGIVTLLAMAASTVVLPHFDVGLAPATVRTQLLACGLAAVARGAMQVMLARLQIAERFALRSTAASLQAVVQVVVCWALLAKGYGTWSLAAGVLTGSAIALAVAHVCLVVRPKGMETTHRHAPIGRFATYRTASTLVGILSSQGDRWVLAAIATPAFLADYDLALRFAVVPLGIVGAMFAGIVSEAPAMTAGNARLGLVRRYTARVAAAVLVMSALDMLGALALSALGVIPASPALITILAMALTWSAANALTAPTTFAFIGTGHPQRELLYAAPTLACLVATWGLAAAAGQPWLVPIGSLLAISAWSLWFTHFGTRRASY